MRKEIDSIGEVDVPSDKYYGAKTQRSRQLLRIGGSSERMPAEIIRAFGYFKKASALTNLAFGLDPNISEAIIKACDEVTAGKLEDHFPLPIWQSGSGTHTNFNVNEVISNRAIEILKGVIGSKKPVHPKDHVNMNQCYNDTFATVMHVAVSLSLKNNLLPGLELLHYSLQEKAVLFNNIVKIGRIHLQDTLPITLGQEFSGYVTQVKFSIDRLSGVLPKIYQLALGGTAVGTGYNQKKDFSENVISKLSELTNLPFVSATNKFEALAANDALIEISGVLNTIACSLTKIANDIRLLSSGPRGGLCELILPDNEPDTDIMVGKVNTTHCEALTMICGQVFGNHVAATFGGSQGHLELNAYKPLIVSNVLRSSRLLGDGCISFVKNCIKGIQVNSKNIEKNLENSLIFVSELTPVVGIDITEKITIKAKKDDTTLCAATVALGVLDEKKFKEIVKPEKMTYPI